MTARNHTAPPTPQCPRRAGAERCDRIPHASISARRGNLQGNTTADNSYMAPAMPQYVTHENPASCPVRVQRWNSALKTPSWPWAAVTFGGDDTGLAFSLFKSANHCDEGPTSVHAHAVRRILRTALYSYCRQTYDTLICVNFTFFYV